MAQNINVDVTPNLFQPTLYYHQGDIGRAFTITISTKDGYTIPSGATVKIEATKPSGLGFSVSGTLSGNVVSFVSTEGMTDEYGRFPAQLKITSGNDILYTANFLMVGAINTHPASVTDGTAEQVISEITLLVERAETAASTAATDAANAAQARVDEMMDYLPSEVSDLKSDISDIADKTDTFIIDKYLYKKNTYINASGVEVTEAGYDLYRIPFDGVSAIYVKWDTSNSFYQFFNIQYVFAGIASDDTVTRFPEADSPLDRYMIDTTNGEAMFVSYNEQAYLSICIKADRTHTLDIQSVSTNSESYFVNSLKTVTEITELNAIKNKFYITPVTVPKVARFAQPNDSDWCYIIACHQGDKIDLTPISGYNYYGLYVDSINVSSTKVTDTYTAQNDGFFIAYGTTSSPYHCTYYPSESIKLEYKNILNTPEDEYNGMNGVAFGTSLTYRSQTTGGYLQFLPTLSGIVFDNQGIGGAGLLSDSKIYVAVANYTDYASKDVCVLEGFVNDWYHEASLGTYTDSESTASVCGRLRWCINYIYSQNPSITLFVVLDHYGRAITGISEASTEVRGGKTQYEYYEELAKVCESLGIPVIKLYAKNRMSENTPQYFIDDIHPNALGAEQTAKTIWAGMKELYPSVK